MMNHHRYNKSTRSFTLIEMLVVISIISTLASVVLAALGSARQRGIFGAATQFSSSLYHTVGDRAAAVFTFDDPNNRLADGSGNNANGSLSTYLSSGEDIWLTSNCAKGDCYSIKSIAPQIYVFPGTTSMAPTRSLFWSLFNIAYANSLGTPSNNYIVIPYGKIVVNSQFTFSFWLKSDFTGVDYSNVNIIHNIGPNGTFGPGSYTIGIYNGKIYANFESYNGKSILLSSASSPATNATINDNQWHNIAVEVNINALSVYVDGRLDVKARLSGSNIFNGFGIDPYDHFDNNYIGCTQTPCYGAVDEVYYYNTAMTADAIHDMYLAQLEERKKFVASALR